MLGKLSFRNAKRQAKDYIIYFITVMMAVALLFSFNSIAVSDDIAELSSIMKNFSKAIIGINIIIVFVMVWLINYTMKFMLEKRSKEFGTYQILGIEKKDIANMFTVENLIIGIIAFVVGTFAGIFIYQFFTTIIMNIFEQPYKISIKFDFKAVEITALCFFGIFLLVLLNSRRKIRKTKVYDLLYADRQNENNKIKSAKGNIFLFILSIVLFLIGLWVLNLDYGNFEEMTGKNTIISVVIFIIGIYLFYISISSFIVKRYLENKQRKYKKNNLFLYRNLTSKINTMRITLGTIAMLFAFIMIGGNVALLMNGMLNNEIEMGYPFEIMVSSLDSDFSRYKEYIQKNAKVTDMYEYKTYYDKHRCYISLTDYNKLREILGYEKVNLADNEVVINCLRTLKKDFEEQVKEVDEIDIANQNMKIKEVRGENFAQIGFNGYQSIYVVPDGLIPAIYEEEQKIRTSDDSELGYYEGFSYKLVAQTEEITSEEFYKGLCDYILYEEIEQTAIVEGEEQSYTINISLGNVSTRGYRMSLTKSFYTIISFLAFYVALIFVMTTATILAIQQLSDSEKYKYRYELLKKLGMDEQEMDRIILKQLLFYFCLPMLIPILLSVPAILIVAQVFTIAVTIGEIWTNMAVVIGMFILVYGIYFIATDVQFCRNVK